MSGRPPVVTAVYGGTNIVISYNETPIVSRNLIERSLRSLNRQKILKGTYEFVDGRVYITIPIPRSVSRDWRTKSYKNWRTETLNMMKAMNTGIQMALEAEEIVKRVLQAA